jgi:dihydrofolate synthase/folylpolyglutamate synthase
MTEMPAFNNANNDLASWLSHIEQLHPNSISMGLERINVVIHRLNLVPKFKIITVAGTNGKGSTCAMLSEIYRQSGYRVASYTSPHLLRYNERMRVNGAEVTDGDLCSAFETVERARLGNHSSEEVSLTYFEMGTLAAIWHFCQQPIDVAVLEIGMGGRLDAVNAFTPDCAVVTSVDIDHQEFLGNTRESIGAEKAGVYRTGIPAICGDFKPPQSLINYAQKIHADFKCINHEFSYQTLNDGWTFISEGQIHFSLPYPALAGEYQLANASCAVAAVESMQPVLPVNAEAIALAMQQVKLAGRFQRILHSPELILDVAHNPHAAAALAKNLKMHKVPNKSKTYSVFSMLADKDIGGVVNEVKHEIDAWYVASIDHPRSASVADLVNAILKATPKANVKSFDSLELAFVNAKTDMRACLDANDNDKIIVFGSFFTVSGVMQYLNTHAAINF